MPRRISDRRWKKKAGAQRLEQSTKSNVIRRVPCTLQIQKTRVETNVLSCSHVIALSCSNSKSNTLILQLPLEISTMRSGHCVVMLSCCRYIIETQNWVKHNRRKELLVRLIIKCSFHSLHSGQRFIESFFDNVIQAHNEEPNPFGPTH